VRRTWLGSKLGHRCLPHSIHPTVCIKWGLLSDERRGVTTTVDYRRWGLMSENQRHFKGDFEKDTFWNLKLASKLNLWKNVEIVQHNTEILATN
jgi:hypothetical protein